MCSFHYYEVGENWALSYSFAFQCLSFPRSLPHSVFQLDTFMECSVYCIITRGEATDLQHL